MTDSVTIQKAANHFLKFWPNSDHLGADKRTILKWILMRLGVTGYGFYSCFRIGSIDCHEYINDVIVEYFKAAKKILWALTPCRLIGRWAAFSRNILSPSSGRTVTSQRGFARILAPTYESTRTFDFVFDPLTAPRI